MSGVRTWRSWFSVSAIVFLLSGAAPVRAVDRQIIEVAEWGNGTSVEEDLKVLAPIDLHIGNEEQWAKLWTAWRGRQSKTPPKVNFSEQLVIVVTSRAELSGIVAKLDDKGNLTVKAVETNSDTFSKKSGDGWYYRLAVINREGIKTINGRPVKKADSSAVLPAETVQDFSERLKKLEQANADLRSAVDRLQKEVDQLKKK